MATATAGALWGTSAVARAYQAGQRPARREVSIGGRRVKVIDIHAHCMIFRPEGLRHLVAECGVGQIMYGTDIPFD